MLITAAISMIVAAAALALTIRSTNGFAVWSDGVAYFLFARSAVIDHDLDISNEFDYLDQRFARDSKAIEPLRKWSTRRADGKIQPAWPVGAGIVMAPFYALGYAVESATAKVAGRPADSYGLIPQVAFALGSVLFGVMGVWCLALTCREIADDEVAYLASLGVVLCGPVVFYMLFNPTMAHAVSFGLVSALTWLWLRDWRHGATVRSLFAIGLLLGIAATVRYQNALFGVLPAALAVKELIQVGWRRARSPVMAGLMASTLPVALLIVPRLTVHSADTGVSVAQYPIDFASPYFLDVLVSCRHGVFHWAPVLAIGLIGLTWAVRRGSGWAGVMLLAFLLNVYLIGAISLSTVAYGTHAPPPGWLHHWDDAPSFGMRYLSECTPLLGLGLATLIQASPPARTVRWIWVLGIAAFALWNALLIVSYGLETISRSGCLPYSDMLHGVGEVIRRIGARI
jgi:hypothetical protein